MVSMYLLKRSNVGIFFSFFAGTGLSCHRIVASICHLAGIKDVRAKIVGSTNSMNVVRAAMQGLTSQVETVTTHTSTCSLSCCFRKHYRVLQREVISLWWSAAEKIIIIL